ncbi:GNAT family N-acetyltransferase [Streptomyces peucetius]|uniref:GNAT family N-acetyltransferase n=2 Tax=Streptomyces peucetius TaxID=1950 RepID=A0ABY6HZD3_STRPE|nr:GNAT family N-acetyltransferase [Streptomyces peucetius]
MDAHRRPLRQPQRPNPRPSPPPGAAGHLRHRRRPRSHRGRRIRRPNGLFLVARLGDGPALACGGWRTLNTSAAEIKRMYVAPPARGQGLGRRILAALEQDVRGRGPTEVLLETGIRNVAALGLYTACGYEPIRSYVPGHPAAAGVPPPHWPARVARLRPRGRGRSLTTKAIANLNLLPQEISTVLRRALDRGDLLAM